MPLAHDVLDIWKHARITARSRADLLGFRLCESAHEIDQYAYLTDLIHLAHLSSTLCVACRCEFARVIGHKGDTPWDVCARNKAEDVALRQVGRQSDSGKSGRTTNRCFQCFSRQPNSAHTQVPFRAQAIGKLCKPYGCEYIRLRSLHLTRQETWYKLLSQSFDTRRGVHSQFPLGCLIQFVSILLPPDAPAPTRRCGDKVCSAMNWAPWA